MKFYTKRGIQSSEVYIQLGSIYLRIGKFQDQVVDRAYFEHKKYKDYHGVKITTWEGYAIATKEHPQMVEIKKETVKKWKIHLHKEMLKEVIKLIFLHNPYTQEK